MQDVIMEGGTAYVRLPLQKSYLYADFASEGFFRLHRQGMLTPRILGKRGIFSDCCTEENSSLILKIENPFYRSAIVPEKRKSPRSPKAFLREEEYVEVSSPLVSAVSYEIQSQLPLQMRDDPSAYIEGSLHWIHENIEYSIFPQSAHNFVASRLTGKERNIKAVLDIFENACSYVCSNLDQKYPGFDQEEVRKLAHELRESYGRIPSPHLKLIAALFIPPYEYSGKKAAKLFFERLSLLEEVVEDVSHGGSKTIALNIPPQKVAPEGVNIVIRDHELASFKVHLTHLTDLFYNFWHIPPQLSAVETIEQRMGKCVNFSHLFVALLRNKGIPANCHGGLINKSDGTWGGHQWASYYLEPYGWVEVDPSGDPSRKEPFRHEAYAYRLIAGEGLKQCKVLEKGSESLEDAIGMVKERGLFSRLFAGKEFKEDLASLESLRTQVP